MVRLFSRGEKRSLGLTFSRKLRVLEKTPLSSFPPQGSGCACRFAAVELTHGTLRGAFRKEIILQDDKVGQSMSNIASDLPEAEQQPYRNGAFLIIQLLAEDLAMQLHAGREGQFACSLPLSCS